MIWHGQDQIGLRAIPTSADMGGFVCITLYAPTFFGGKVLFFASCRVVRHVIIIELVSNWKVMCHRLACVDGNYLLKRIKNGVVNF